MSRQKEQYTNFEFFWEGEKKVFKIQPYKSFHDNGTEICLTGKSESQGYRIFNEWDENDSEGKNFWYLFYDPLFVETDGDEEKLADTEFLAIVFAIHKRKVKKYGYEEYEFTWTLTPKSIELWVWDNHGNCMYNGKSIPWSKAIKPPKGYVEPKKKTVKRASKKDSDAPKTKKKFASEIKQEVVQIVLNEVKKFVSDWSKNNYTFLYKSDQREGSFTKTIPDFGEDTNIIIYSMKDGKRIEPYHVSYQIREYMKSELQQAELSYLKK